MNEKQFMQRLKRALHWRLPPDTALDIIRDYEGFFAQGRADGRTEQDVCLGLGDPVNAARELSLAFNPRKYGFQADYVRRAVYAAFAAIIGIMCCFLAYNFYGIYFRGYPVVLNWLGACAFFAALWLIFFGTPKSCAVSIKNMVALKSHGLRRAFCHGLLVCIPASFIALCLIVIYCLPASVPPERWGRNIQSVMNAYYLITLLTSAYAVYGFYRRTIKYFPILAHAAGIIAFLNAADHFLRSLDDFSRLLHTLLNLALIYAIAPALAAVSYMLIKKLKGGRPDGSAV